MRPFVATPDFIHVGLLLPSKICSKSGSPPLVCSSGRSGPLLPAPDYVHLDVSAFLRSLSCMGSVVFALDFLHLESTLPLQFRARPGHSFVVLCHKTCVYNAVRVHVERTRVSEGGKLCTSQQALPSSLAAALA
eukprot:173512-Amphidinium_carterae.1